MKITKKGVWVLFAFLFLPICANAGTWTTIPILSGDGMDIDGDNIVATNKVYNIITQTVTTLNMPNVSSVFITGIDGDNLVGNYGTTPNSNGFLYDGINWTTITKSESYGFKINGICGNNIVGSFSTDRGEPSHGFLYDGTNWITLDMPGATSTTLYGIESTNIVGHSNLGNFMYNFENDSWTIIDVPGILMGISGNNLVGYTFSGHGFLYDGINLTYIDVPGASETRAYGIDGDNIVGFYYADGQYHGFLYTIPEPTTFLLFSLTGLLVAKRTR
jgi:hypothetical protein